MQRLAAGLLLLQLVPVQTLLAAPGSESAPPGVVPQVGLQTRIAGDGTFEVREVRADGSLAPWSEFEVRGIDVGWTPSGVYPWTANPPMLANPAFYDVLDKLRDAGVNTLRFYFLPGSASGPWAAQTRATLDVCYQMGFKILWALDGSLIGNPQARTALSTSVQAFGNHPTTLGFALGNEWNLNLGHAASVAKAADVQSLATFLATVDPGRAVISSLVCGPDNDLFERRGGGTTTATEIVRVASAVDLWGMNLYRAGTFHPFFHLWPAATSAKPYAVFEWGADSWNQNTGAVDYATQALETAWHLDEARRVGVGPSRQPAYAGTIVFAAVDEWWKNPFANNSLAVQESTGFLTTPTRSPPSQPSLVLQFRADADGHRSEEHFGILELPALVEKPVFTTVADRFNQRTTPRPDLDLALFSAGWMGPGGGLDNGYWGLRINGNDVWHQEGGGIARGLNVVVFDTSTGSIGQLGQFDTYDAVQSGTSAIADATAFINALPTGALVGMAVADTLTHWNGNPAPYAALIAAIQARTGSTRIGSIGYQNGWCSLGLVDAPAPLAEATPAANTQVDAAATVILDLDADGVGDDVDADLDGDGSTNAWENARGTDAVRPRGQLLAQSMTLDPARILRIAIQPGDAAGSLTDIDFRSLRLELATPVSADVSLLLLTIFSVTVPPTGGIALTSTAALPRVPGGRLVLRFLDRSGRLYAASVRID